MFAWVSCPSVYTARRLYILLLCGNQPPEQEDAARPQEMLSKGTDAAIFHSQSSVPSNFPPKAKSPSGSLCWLCLYPITIQDPMLRLIIQKQTGGLCIPLSHAVTKSGSRIPCQSGKVTSVRWDPQAAELLAGWLLGSSSSPFQHKENASTTTNKNPSRPQKVLKSSDAPAGARADTKLLGVGRLSVLQPPGVESQLKHKREPLSSHK